MPTTTTKVEIPAGYPPEVWVVNLGRYGAVWALGLLALIATGVVASAVGVWLMRSDVRAVSHSVQIQTHEEPR